jgi:hypothetical protein
MLIVAAATHRATRVAVLMTAAYVALPAAHEFAGKHRLKLRKQPANQEQADEQTAK